MIDIIPTHTVIMHNDDHNDFQYVMACLIKFCKHEALQAEQCALITHYIKKCNVKEGDLQDMYYISENLLKAGLTVTLEKYTQIN